MTIKMWDLAGAEDDLRFSPFCWRIRMALAHMGLAFETVPWRFTERAAIGFSGQGLVPVILDGEREVHDSWAIAEYLEATYAERPRLFQDEQAKALSLFFKAWCERIVHPAVLRVVIGDVFARLREKDKAYFRESREKRFGMTLEALAAQAPQALEALRGALDPARSVLAQQPFVAGAAPAFADYVLFGAFQWARAVSPTRLLEAGDPLHDWRERILGLHGGLARSARGYPV